MLFINRLKPLLDSFQSCFKDSCRYFAGLHFVYRLGLFIALLLGQDTQLYIFGIIYFSISLLVHSVLRPYKNRLHNIFDSLLFGNLLFIVAISLLAKARQNHHNIDNNYTVDATDIIRLILVYIPLVSVIGYYTFSVVALLRRKSSKQNAGECDSGDDFPYRFLESDSDFWTFSLLCLYIFSLYFFKQLVL